MYECAQKDLCWFWGHKLLLKSSRVLPGQSGSQEFCSAESAVHLMSFELKSGLERFPWKSCCIQKENLEILKLKLTRRHPSYTTRAWKVCRRWFFTKDSLGNSRELVRSVSLCAVRESPPVFNPQACWRYSSHFNKMMKSFQKLLSSVNLNQEDCLCMFVLLLFRHQQLCWPERPSSRPGSYGHLHDWHNSHVSRCIHCIVGLIHSL